MNIEVIPPKFDLHGYYEWQIKVALQDANLPTKARITKLKALVQRAYEQGIMDAKRDKTYFEDY